MARKKVICVLAFTLLLLGGITVFGASSSLDWKSLIADEKNQVEMTGTSESEQINRESGAEFSSAETSRVASTSTEDKGPFKQIFAGLNHTALLTSTGDIWMWGGNEYNKMGTSKNGLFDESNRLVPTKPSNFNGVLKDITAISGGFQSSVVLNSSGKVYAWGYNYYETLGLGDDYRFPAIIVPEPHPVYEISNIVSVKSKNDHTLGVRADGTLWSWGNTIGVGRGEVYTLSYPGQVKNHDGSGYLTEIIDADAGQYHSLALKSDGSVWSFGANESGQLGREGLHIPEWEVSGSFFPVQVYENVSGTAFNNVISISAGNNFNLALKSDGTVWAWGDNTSGQLGIGTLTNQTYPVQVKGEDGTGFLTDIIAISGGGNHSLALKSDGTVWSWGNNTDGQLGDGSNINRLTPVRVKGSGNEAHLANVQAIDAGESHNVAYSSDQIFTWGSNGSGQLGNGTTLGSNIPVLIHISSLSKVYEYDDVGRLKSIIVNKEDSKYNREFTYDENGNLKSKRETEINN